MKSRKTATPAALTCQRSLESPDQRFVVSAVLPDRSAYEQVADWVTRYEETPKDVYIRWKFSKADIPNKSFVLETNSSIYLLQLCNILFRNGLNPTIHDTSSMHQLRMKRVLDEESNDESVYKVPREHINKSFTHLPANFHGGPALPSDSEIAHPSLSDGKTAGLHAHVPTSLALGPDKYLHSLDTAQTFSGSASHMPKASKVAALVRNGRNVMVELNHSPSNLKTNVRDPYQTAIGGLQSSQFLEASLHLNSSSGTQPLASPDTTHSPAADKKKKISCVVYVKGFDQRATSLEQLTRVFQCFGVVENALLHTKKEYALIKFSNARGAKTSIKELYGKEIAGRKLLIHYSEFGELTNRYFTNEKCYYQPKKPLRAVADMPPASALSRHVTLWVMPSPAKNTPQLTLDELVKAIHLPRHAAILNPCKGVVNELRLEFPSILSVIDFAQDFNYREFESRGFFTALTFVHT
jgi:RNA recognition motif-containing protein